MYNFTYVYSGSTRAYTFLHINCENISGSFLFPNAPLFTPGEGCKAAV